MAIVQNKSRNVRRALGVLGCVLGLSGVLGTLGACDSSSEEAAGEGGRSLGAAAGPAKPVVAAAAEADKKKASDNLSFKDDDFVESEHNRDPFRSYTSSMSAGKSEPEGVPQRRVIMPTTAVESMRLMAIISGMPRPKAMLIDSLGVGYVVERGDYVGRGKVLQSSGTVQMVLNWRVDRIRENEVVLTRADATDPTRPPLSRIITMREEVAAK